VIYQCCKTLRLDLVKEYNSNPQNSGNLLNGIDYLEVLDKDAPSLSPPQQTLMVHLIQPVPSYVTADNVVIGGGERIQNIGVLWATAASNKNYPLFQGGEAGYFSSLPNADHILLVRTNSAGDFSTYQLELVASALQSQDGPPSGFDPQLCEIDFSFKVECPSPFDCAPPPADCPAPTPSNLDINYLAKDYGSFLTLIQNRLSQLIPGYAPGTEADLAVALSELIAYVGDYLSYQQDAVTTEAYLETARRRVSLRRHALLVDYHVSDGCNARTWVQVQIQPGSGPVTLTQPQPGQAGKPIRFYTFQPGMPVRLTPGSDQDRQAQYSGAQVFEPLLAASQGQATLYPGHNQINFYTWSDQQCCLPTGSTEATLVGPLPNLAAGDVLVFEEVMGPLTGEAGDADPAHRWAVQLTQVTPGTDPLTNQAVVEIDWGAADALPFPLCLSSVTDEANGSQPLQNVSIASGNILLTDNGMTLVDDFGSVFWESLGQVQVPTLQWAPSPSVNHCNPPPTPWIPVPFRPVLQQSPLTQAAPLSFTSATQAMAWILEDVVPAITLDSTLNEIIETWGPKQDLLDSDAEDPDFVVEIESDGTSTLRFGDGINGLNPAVGTSFTASYRVGNGTAGNVGGEAIAHIASQQAFPVLKVRNPLPAQGGVDPETAAQIQRRAPQAFNNPPWLRAVIPSDYAAIAGQYPGVEQAEAQFRWTGSWHTVFLSAEPTGGGAVSTALEQGITQYVDSYRMAGYDLQVESPLYVSLEIDLNICVDSDYFRSDVEQALLQVLGNQSLPNGQTGFFYPDNFTFGQTVYLSGVYAAARTVTGVQTVQATLFGRQGIPDGGIYLATGEMEMGSLEIARLYNDPNFPEYGILRLTFCGGK
jgi:hypothetical protein